MKDFMNKFISSNEEEGAPMKSKTLAETLGDHQNSCSEFSVRKKKFGLLFFFFLPPFVSIYFFHPHF